MILDQFLQLDPAATPVTVTAASTNVIDLLNARDIAIGDAFESPEIVATITTTFTAVGAATLRIQYQGSTDNVTFTTYAQTDDIPKANLLAGTVIKLRLSPQPPHAAGLPRYHRVNYVVTTGPFTAGKLQCDLVPVAQQNNNPPAYPPGVTVSN